MSLVAVIPQMTHDEAERITEQITFRLDTIADNYEVVMPLIREAIERGAHDQLGYLSPGAYVSEQFGGALSRLGVEVRREVVRELSAAGMSSRAIAPIVGVTDRQVRRDLPEVGHDVPPAEPELSGAPRGLRLDDIGGLVSAGLITSIDDVAALISTGEVIEPTMITETHTIKTVMGLDGKTYTKPEPKPVPTGDAANQINAETMSKEIGHAIDILSLFENASHRARVLTSWWPLGNGAVPPASRALFNPAQLRQIAESLGQLATEMESTNV